jgi:lysophospholipase L1-like esterase
MSRPRRAELVVLTLVAAIVAACGSTTAPVATATPVPTRAPVTTATTAPATAAATAVSTPGAVGSLPALPAGALSIVTLGDSLTEGTGDETGQGGYPGRLKELLAPVRADSRVTNLGHSGLSSTDLINGLNGVPSQLRQALGLRANVALVWIGSNDLWYLYEYGPEPMTADAEAQDLAAYEANIDTILSTLTAHGMTVFIALLDDQSKRPVAAHPNPAEPAFPATTAADLALMSAHMRDYNAIIARKAAQYGASTVDFLDTTIFTDSATLYSDGNHPNSAGYDAIAAMWFAAIRTRLG